MCEFTFLFQERQPPRVRLFVKDKAKQKKIFSCPQAEVSWAHGGAAREPMQTALRSLMK